MSNEQENGQTDKKYTTGSFKIPTVSLQGILLRLLPNC
jgi:hypothetical protein